MAAMALVAASSLLIIDNVGFQPAEAGGANCPLKGGAATSIDPNAPSAVNTKTATLAVEPTV